MKFLFVMSAVVTLVNCGFIEEATRRLLKNFSECASVVGINNNELAVVLSGKDATRYETKCFLMCFNKRYGIQNSNGKFNKSTANNALRDIKRAAPKVYEKAAKVFDKCIDEVGSVSDGCEAAAKFFQCYNTNGKSMGLRPGMIPM